MCGAYAPVKRETGENPVRTRHCIQGNLRPDTPLGNREGGRRL